MSADDSDSAPESPWDAEAFRRDPDSVIKKIYERSAKKLSIKPFDPLLSLTPILSYEEKYLRCPPHMDETISLIGPERWSLGSLMICEKLDVTQNNYEYELSSLSELSLTPRNNIVCQWEDSGSTYCLRRRSEPKWNRNVEGDPEATRLIKKGTSGVWSLSPNVVCKTMWWGKDSTTDATTIRFINKNIPSVPTEEVMHDWIDIEWRRSFMLAKRAPGTRFDEAWPLLTTEHKLQVAEQIAIHVKSLSAFTSKHIETVTGNGIEGIHSLRLRVDLPECMPRIEPPVSKEEYRKFLQRRHKNLEPPDFGDHFVLQHPDLNPTNFFVTVPAHADEAAKLTNIIDWSGVGYYPLFHVATWPRGRLHFAVEENPDGADWMWMLSNAVVKIGFPLEMDYLTRIWPSWSIQHNNLPK